VSAFNLKFDFAFPRVNNHASLVEMKPVF
jgi:hypothetical protein